MDNKKTWWQSALQYVGGASILIALFSYVTKVENRITIVETEGMVQTKLLNKMDAKLDKMADKMVTKDYLDAKLGK